MLRKSDTLYIVTGCIQFNRRKHPGWRNTEREFLLVRVRVAVAVAVAVAVPRCQGARVPGCQGARVPECQGQGQCQCQCDLGLTESRKNIIKVFHEIQSNSYIT